MYFLKYFIYSFVIAGDNVFIHQGTPGGDTLGNNKQTGLEIITRRTDQHAEWYPDRDAAFLYAYKMLII